VALRVGASIVGAVFADPEFEDQEVFPNFALLQSAVGLLERARFPRAGGAQPLSENPRRALCLGLGAASVPNRLRSIGWTADVVERNSEVIRAASSHFAFEASPHLGRGVTVEADAKQLLLQPRPTDAHTDPFGGARYDAVLHDLFTGESGTALASTDALRRLRDEWLVADGSGVLFLEAVGYHAPGHEDAAAAPRARGAKLLDPHLLMKLLRRRLLRVFRTVRCFLELPPRLLPEETDASGARTGRRQLANLIFVATNRAPEDLRWSMVRRRSELEWKYRSSGSEWPLPPPATLPALRTDWVSLRWQEFELPALGGSRGPTEAEEGAPGEEEDAAVLDALESDADAVSALQRRVDDAMWRTLIRPLLPDKAWGADLRGGA
jgi:hypothetical protein